MGSFRLPNGHAHIDFPFDGGLKWHQRSLKHGAFYTELNEKVKGNFNK